MRKVFAKNSPAAPEGFLAVDIGGTKLAVGLVTEGGELVSRSQVPTPERDVWGALSSLIETQRVGSDFNLIACGVGCGGPMTRATPSSRKGAVFAADS